MVGGGTPATARDLPGEIEPDILLDSPRIRDFARFAALCGPVFRFTKLATGDWTEPEAASLLQSLLEAGMVTEAARAGEYEFVGSETHAALLGELSPMRRAMLHGEVAEALERAYGSAVTHHSEELAGHFVESAAIHTLHACKAIHYSHVSAERAELKHKWGDVARWYEHGAELIAEHGTPCPHFDVVTLRHRAAEAWARQGEWRRAWRQIMYLLQHYRNSGEAQRFAEVVLSALRHVDPPPAKRIALAQEALDAIGDGDPELSAKLYIQLAWFEDGPEGTEAVNRARELVRLTTTESAAGLEQTIEEREVLLSLGVGLTDEAMALTARHVARGLQSGDHVGTARSLCRLAQIAIRGGDLHRAEALALDALAFSRNKNIRTIEQSSLYVLCALALSHAQFDRFDELWGQTDATPTQRLLRARRAEMVGDIDGAFGALPDWSTPGMDHPRAAWDQHGTLARIHWRAGRMHEAGTELDTWFALRDASHYPLDRQDAFASIATALPDLARDELIVALLDESRGWGEVKFLYTSVVALARVQGDLALHLNLLDEADHYYASAQAWAESQGAYSESALALGGQAAIARARGDELLARSYSERARELRGTHGIAETGLACRELETFQAARGEPEPQLSPREREVLKLVSDGLTNRQIAECLHISHHTVSRHVSNVLQKTGALNRVKAAFVVARLGEIDPA